MRRLCDALAATDAVVSDAATVKAAFSAASAAMLMIGCFSNATNSVLLSAGDFHTFFDA